MDILCSMLEIASPFFAHRGTQILNKMLISGDLIFSNVDSTCGGMTYYMINKNEHDHLGVFQLIRVL